MIVVPGRIFDNIIGIYIIIVVPGSIFASIMVYVKKFILINFL